MRRLMQKQRGKVDQLPFASIVVPTWNGEKYVEECLKSLLSQDYPDFEVIVVDNASQDATAGLVAKGFPRVRLIRNERNLGFAGGVNVGLRSATGDVLVLFNQDAAAEPGWLQTVVDCLTAVPDIGVVGCKILQWDGNILWHAGVEYDPSRGCTSLRGLGEIDRGQYDQPMDMTSVVGAAMAFKREVWDKIGGLDEDFFFNLEDTDYCWRARKAGYRVLYAPGARVRHRGGASLGSGSRQAIHHYHRSRLLFLLKHFDVSWFGNPFLPAEIEWLNTGLSFEEYCILRETYLETMTGCIRGMQAYRFVRDRFTDEQRERVAMVFSRLAESVVEALHIDPGNRLWGLGEQTGHWWQVKELPFTSSLPLIGPLVARFRAVWNNVAARWYVRRLLVQQLEVNRRLVFNLELNNRLIQELNRDMILLNQRLARVSLENDAKNREGT